MKNQTTQKIKSQKIIQPNKGSARWSTQWIQLQYSNSLTKYKLFRCASLAACCLRHKREVPSVHRYHGTSHQLLQAASATNPRWTDLCFAKPNPIQQFYLKIISKC